MKSCGCIRYYANYPCGHQLSRFEFCIKAKAKNLFKRGKPTPCSTHTSDEILPNLEENCGSVCLTRSFQCTRCGAAKQNGWRCSRCRFLRGPETEVWSTCTCSRHRCLEVALGKYGKALCTPCNTGPCAQRPGKKPRARTRRPPKQFWKCHKCSRKRCTPAKSMKCGSPGVDGCDHTLCGECQALFKCICKCGCSYNFVEGGPKICEWCVESCSNS